MSIFSKAAAHIYRPERYLILFLAILLFASFSMPAQDDDEGESDFVTEETEFEEEETEGEFEEEETDSEEETEEEFEKEETNSEAKSEAGAAELAEKETSIAAESAAAEAGLETSETPVHNHALHTGDSSRSMFRRENARALVAVKDFGAAQAAAKPAIIGRFSVPLRRPFSGPPPSSRGGSGFAR